MPVKWSNGNFKDQQIQMTKQGIIHLYWKIKKTNCCQIAVKTANNSCKTALAKFKSLKSQIVIRFIYCQSFNLIGQDWDLTAVKQLL